MSELLRRAAIREHAEAAAEAGKGPESCPYAEGTDPEKCWKDCFYTALGFKVIREAA